MLSFVSVLTNKPHLFNLLVRTLAKGGVKEYYNFPVLDGTASVI